jgi:hypothetical protein
VDFVRWCVATSPRQDGLEGLAAGAQPGKQDEHENQREKSR